MKSIITSLFLVLHIFAFAQKHDYNWAISNSKVILNFHSEIIEILEQEELFYLRENAASINDMHGNLLFITNGCEIIGKDFSLIENGDSLNPGFQTDLQCSSGNLGPQGSLFLPHPVDSNLYYLFHLAPDWFPPFYSVGHHFYYSLLDKSLGPNGAVLEKNQLLLQDTFTVGLVTAAKHANGRDWWVVIPEMASNKLYRFLLDPEGIHGPWEQRIGTVHQDDSHTGQVVFSPDGKHYARVDGYNELHLYDFDRCTGLFSNHQYIDLPTVASHLSQAIFCGAAFSPNSQFLYISRPEFLYQLDMQANNLQASLTEVAEFDGFGDPVPGYFRILQLAPNGKIYQSDGNGNAHLNVIENPNEKTPNCNFTQHSVLLPHRNHFSLPNNPNYRLGRLEESACDTLYVAPDSDYPLCQAGQIKVFPNPFQKELTIQFDDCFIPSFHFILYDVLGREVWNAPFQNPEIENTCLLPDLTGQVYFYQLQVGNKFLKSGKLVRIK